MIEGTSDYWRKLLKADEPVPAGFLKKFHSLLEIFRPLYHGIVYLLARYYFKIEVYGIENVPKEPPFIIAPNHVSILDYPISTYPLNRKLKNEIYTVAERHFYDRAAARIFMKIGTNTMRIDAAKDFFPALRAAANVIRSGKAIYINPEGTRSETGELLPFRVGVGVLAVETNCPILPVYIDGTYDAMRRGSLFPKPVKVRVYYGRPIYMEDFIEKKLAMQAYDVYKEVTDELFKRVSLLKVGKKNI